MRASSSTLRRPEESATVQLYMLTLVLGVAVPLALVGLVIAASNWQGSAAPRCS